MLPMMRELKALSLIVSRFFPSFCYTNAPHDEGTERLNPDEIWPASPGVTLMLPMMRELKVAPRFINFFTNSTLH